MQHVCGRVHKADTAHQNLHRNLAKKGKKVGEIFHEPNIKHQNRHKHEYCVMKRLGLAGCSMHILINHHHSEFHLAFGAQFNSHVDGSPALSPHSRYI
jgi:hypothetical protein